MPNPVDRIQTELKDALKARDTVRRDTLRLLLTALKNEQIARGEALDDNAFQAITKRLVKQRRESAQQFRAGGRDELADQEEAEIGVLEIYLPHQASDDEIRAAIEALVAEQGWSGPRAMGPLMQAMIARFGATADGKTISRIAREVLG